MIGAIIGAGLSIAGSVAGGVAARKEAQKRAAMLESEKARNQAWYDRRYNEDSTQRADAQAALTRMREAMAERSARAAGTAAVMGGTEESVAAEKAAQNNALAGAVSDIAARGEARKDSVEAQYRDREAGLTGAEMQASTNKSAGIASAIGGVAGAGAGIAQAYASKQDAMDILNKLKGGGTTNGSIK